MPATAPTPIKRLSLRAAAERGFADGWWQVLSVSVRDTMAHAPAGQKALADLGAACGVAKRDVPDGWIAGMTGYRAAHLVQFLEYGINDAVIVVVEYLARLWVASSA